MCSSPTLPRQTLHAEYFLPVQLDMFKPLQTEQSHFICASYNDQWQSPLDLRTFQSPLFCSPDQLFRSHMYEGLYPSAVGANGSGAFGIDSQAAATHLLRCPAA